MPTCATSARKPPARCSALESQLTALVRKLEHLELDNAKLQHRQEVLLRLCLSTQWLGSIISVNGPRLQGPLHTSLCSASRSAAEQVERTSSSLLGGVHSGPLAIQQPCFNISSWDQQCSACVMDGNCLSMLEYGLASVHAAPEQYACWVGASVQQLNDMEQQLREDLASMMVPIGMPAAAARPSLSSSAAAAAGEEGARPLPPQCPAPEGYQLAPGVSPAALMKVVLEYICVLVVSAALSTKPYMQRYSSSSLPPPSEAYWRQQTLALGLSQQQVEGVVAAMATHLQLQAQSRQHQEEVMVALRTALPPLPAAGSSPCPHASQQQQGGDIAQPVCSSQQAAAAAAAAAGAAEAAAGAAEAAAAEAAAAAGAWNGLRAAPSHSISHAGSSSSSGSVCGSQETPGTPQHSDAGSGCVGNPLFSPVDAAAPLQVLGAYDTMKELAWQLEVSGRKHAWLCMACACHLIGCLTLRQVATFAVNTAPYPIPVPSWGAWLVGTVANEGPAGLVAQPGPSSHIGPAVAEPDGGVAATSSSVGNHLNGAAPGVDLGAVGSTPETQAAAAAAAAVGQPVSGGQQQQHHQQQQQQGAGATSHASATSPLCLPTAAGGAGPSRGSRLSLLDRELQLLAAAFPVALDMSRGSSE